MKIKLRDIVTLDFETYYSKEYSLTKKEYNTSSYIRSPLFKAHCVGIKDGIKKTVWYESKDIAAALKKHRVAERPLMCHNTQFDGFILSQHYGVVPAFYLDTLAMSRALHGTLGRNDLDTVSRLYGRGGKVKPAALKKVKGIRDLPPDLLDQLAEYMCGDTDECYEIGKIQLEVFPQDELMLIDWTIRAFCDPVLRIDGTLVQEELDDEISGKAAKQRAASVGADVLQSSEKFAASLESLGVDPPMKLNKDGELIYAFAKNDLAFQDLLDHEDDRVVALVEARLATKSTQGETRARRMLELVGRPVPVAYNYCGAHTTRWSGGNKLNFQNFPRQSFNKDGSLDLTTGRLRRSVIAPPGHVLVVCDSAQIEARVNAWLSDQLDVLEVFASGGDIYKRMASQIYGVSTEQVTKDQRFIGKIACLSSDTLVLTLSGWKPILDVSDTDLVWDGVEWVSHQGVAARGVKPTQLAHSVRATADHEILTGRGWLAWSEVHTNLSLLQSALSLANLPSSIGAPTLNQLDVLRDGNQLYAARADGKAASTATTFLQDAALGVTHAQKWPRAQSAGGNIKKLSPMTSTVCAFLTACRRASRGVGTLIMQRMKATAGAALKYILNGAQTVLPSFATPKHLMGGTALTSTSIESTSIKGMSREMYGLSAGAITQGTSGVSTIGTASSPNCELSEMTYDLLSAGPRNRFVIWSDKGPLIVHNCLGLGYGMGWKKFQATLAMGTMGPAVFISDAEAQRIVRMYRKAASKIKEMWERSEQILGKMIMHEEGSYKCLEWDHETIWLPNGLGLHYYALNAQFNGEKYTNFQYRERGKYKKIYGGLAVENKVQALSRVIIGDQLLRTQAELKKLPLKRTQHARVVMTTHDELVGCVPKAAAKDTLAMMLSVMRTPPRWCKDIPLNAEGDYDVMYSK